MEAWTCPGCRAINRSGYCMRCGKVPPAVESVAKRHAQEFASQSARSPMLGAFPEAFDFSPESLARIDALLNELFGPEGQAPGSRDWQPEGATLRSVIDFGAYLGEVLHRHLPARWQASPQHPSSVIQARVVDGTGRSINTFAQVAIRFRDGSTAPIAGLYTALTGKSLPPWTIPERAGGRGHGPASFPATPTPTAPPPSAPTKSVVEQLREARWHLERGHRQNAASSLRAPAASAPTLAERGQRAELWIRAEAFEDALREIEFLREAEPEADGWVEQQALVKARLGRLDEALEGLASVLQRRPQSGALRRRHAFLLLKAGRWSDAADTLGALLASAPGDPELLLGAAHAALQLGNVSEGRRQLEALLRLPQAPAALRSAATERLRQLPATSGAPGPVTPVAKDAAGEAPPAATAYAEALKHARAGRFFDALPWFKRAAELEPARPAYWKDLGNCLKDVREYPAARASLEHALNLDPGYSLARYLLGECHEGESQMEAAVACYRAILADPVADPKWVSRAFDRLQALGRA